MARDADSHKADDERRREEIDVKNHLDSAVYSAEKTLKEHRDKVSDADAKAVEEAVEEAKKALAEGGLERMKTAQDKLLQSSHKVAEAMYTAAAPQGGQQPPTGEAPGDEQPKKDDVVDAEFVDVDEKK